VLAVPATTNVRGIPTEVSLDESDGMPLACVLALDGVSLIRPALCTERIARLGADKLHAVCEALRAATACA
jgi:mRNA-degrading endonuclease toxin of MazEF toxin-antitoxin module